MELKDVYVGQLVRVVDTVPTKGFNWRTFSVAGEREGIVLEVDHTDCELQVCIELNGIQTWDVSKILNLCQRYLNLIVANLMYYNESGITYEVLNNET